jgi:hypothetical protein
MKTKKQIRKHAEGVAWAHFYSDEDTPWEPFENYPQDWIDEQVESLADAVERAMLWAQQGETK